MNVKKILVGMLLIMISTVAITESNGGRGRKGHQKCTGASCSLQAGKQEQGRRGHRMKHDGKRHGGRHEGRGGHGMKGRGMHDKGIKAQNAEKETTSSAEASESKD